MRPLLFFPPYRGSCIISQRNHIINSAVVMLHSSWYWSQDIRSYCVFEHFTVQWNAWRGVGRGAAWADFSSWSAVSYYSTVREQSRSPCMTCIFASLPKHCFQTTSDNAFNTFKWMNIKINCCTTTSWNTENLCKRVCSEQQILCILHIPSTSIEKKTLL